MNHSIEFGRSSWAGAQWGSTSLGSSGFSTAARSTLSPSFTPNQGDFATGICGTAVTNLASFQDRAFGWPPTRELISQSRWWLEPGGKRKQKNNSYEIQFLMRLVIMVIMQRVRSGEERNSQGDRVPEEVGCHRQRRFFATNLSFYSVCSCALY